MLDNLSPLDPAALVERIAVIQAHRATHSAEHDVPNGKIHGYCIVCGVPFPCAYVGNPPAPLVNPSPKGAVDLGPLPAWFSKPESHHDFVDISYDDHEAVISWQSQHINLLEGLVKELAARKVDPLPVVADAARQELRAWPVDGRGYEILFAVPISGDAVLVEAPESVRNANDDSNWMGSDWEGIPEEPGFYKAKATFWFQQGYFEGYPADGESSFGWGLFDCIRIDAQPASTPEAEPIHARGEPPRQCRFCGSKSGYVAVRNLNAGMHYLKCVGCGAKHPIDYSDPPPASPEAEQSPSSPVGRECMVLFNEAGVSQAVCNPEDYPYNHPLISDRPGWRWVRMVPAALPTDSKEGV